MFLLPIGKPLVENLPISKLQLPEALDKLKNGRLTGYALFDFPAAKCVLFYEEGKLVNALLRRGNAEQNGAETLDSLAELLILSDSGSFTVYSFSKGINQALMALICGNKIIRNQEMKQIDFRSLIERIKNERMTAALKISADQHVGMILYRDGETVGFFDDTGQTVGTTPGEVQNIASLPGATADLCILKIPEELFQDLSVQVNIRSLWDSAKLGVFTRPEATRTLPPQAVVPASQPSPPAANSVDVETAIFAIAHASLGKLGKTLAEKELSSAGGISSLKDKSRLATFLDTIEKSSKLLASPSKIREMRDAITLEVARL